jgi:hypothetical protein
LIRSYYFFKAVKFGEDLRSKQQMVISGTETDVEPATEIKKVESDSLMGLTQFCLIHETRDKRPRRLLGDPRYVNETIAGGKTPYDIYFDENTNMLIARAPKTVVNSAFKKLAREFPLLFKVERHEVNFANIIDKTTSTILGAWFGLEGRIKSIGLFGDRVNLDDSFNRYQQAGSMTALYIDMEFENSKKSTIMVTKECGVIIYDEWDIEQDLKFLINIMKPLIFDIV